MTSKRTDQLKPSDRVTTPDGTKSGVVRAVHPGGVPGDRAGVTSVQFQHESVRPVDPTAGKLPSPRGWALNVPDGDQWEVGSNEPLSLKNQ